MTPLILEVDIRQREISSFTLRLLYPQTKYLQYP